MDEFPKQEKIQERRPQQKVRCTSCPQISVSKHPMSQTSCCVLPTIKIPSCPDVPITQDAIPVSEAMMSHPRWSLINKVLLRKNKSVAELQRRSEEMMEWILQVANNGVLPAMALYQVLHLYQDTSSSWISTNSRSSSSLQSKDRASSQGSSQNDVPEGIMSERSQPLLESGQGSRSQDSLSSGKSPTRLCPSQPTEEDIRTTASLTMAEIISKLKGAMARDEDDEEAKMSAIVEELCVSAMEKVMDELALHRPPGSSLSEFYAASISEDLILNTWQDAKEKIQALADIHADAVCEQTPPQPLLSSNTSMSEEVFHREKQEAKKMASLLISSVVEAEEMEKATVSPRSSCSTVGSTGSGHSSVSSAGRIRRDTEPRNPCSLRESLSDILAHHTLFQSQGVFHTEDKLELVRLVGGILQGMMTRERGSSLSQPQDAYMTCLPQNVSGACNIIQIVLENFSAAAELIREERVDFLLTHRNDFTLLAECVSESLLSQVTEELEALQRRNQGVSSSSGRSSRRRSSSSSQGNWVKGNKEMEEDMQQEASPSFSRPASSCQSHRSEASVASCHDLYLAVYKMLDTVMRTACSASRSVSNDEDSSRLFDRAECDLGRLPASHGTGSSMELISRLYERLLDTPIGHLPSTHSCCSETNIQNLEVKQRLDWELFSPLLSCFIQLALRKQLENFLGLTTTLTDECIPVNDYLKWPCEKDSADSVRDVSCDSSDSVSLEGLNQTMPGSNQGTVGRPSSPANQNQMRALEAMTEVLTTKVRGVLQSTCNNPEKVMVIVNKGLDAEVMARIANLSSSSSSEATTPSLNQELSSGFINLDVGHAAKVDIIVYDNVPADYVCDFYEEEETSEGLTKGVAVETHTKGDGKYDGASGLLEVVPVLPWLPPRPSETLSLQALMTPIQEKVKTSSRSSALHHQTLRDLLHSLMARLALQESPSTSSAPTFLQLEATLLQEVGWIVRTQEGIRLVLEHLPQSPAFSGEEALDAMVEAAYAQLPLDTDSGRALLCSARRGEAGAVCSLAETIAKVICRHAEDWCAPAVSDDSVHFGCEEKDDAKDSAGLEKASGSSGTPQSNVRVDDESDRESSGSAKASEIQADGQVRKRCEELGLEKARECPVSSGSQEDLKSHLQKAKPSCLRRWFTLMSQKTKVVPKVTQNTAGSGKKKNRKTNSVTPLNTSEILTSVPCPGPALAESSSAPVEEEQKKKKKKSKGFFRRMSAALAKAFCCSCMSRQ